MCIIYAYYRVYIHFSFVYENIKIIYTFTFNIKHLSEIANKLMT